MTLTGIRFTGPFILAFSLMWGVFFMELGAGFALGLLLSAGAIYFSIARNLRMDTVGIILLLNIFYWLGHGMATGGIDLKTFLNIRFYTGDGRIFLSLAPLLAFCLIQTRAWDFYAHLKNLHLLAIVSVVLYLIWMVTHTSMLSGQGHPDEFHGFLSSHTGSGTYFGALAVFFIIFTAEKQKALWLILGLMLLGPMFSSGSREALVGCMAALGWYWGIKRKHPKIMVAGALVILLMIPVTSTMSNKTYNRTIGLISWEMVDGMISQAQYGISRDWQVGDWSPESDTDNLESGDVTTLVRIMLWVYASKRFIDSPLFGIGWGRFNDKSPVFVDVPILGTFVGGGEQVFSTANAHNSYFQLLSESGLVGITMYGLLWLVMFLRCLKAEKIFTPFRNERSYFVACQGLIIYILFCALTGHALASPSVMIPVVTILGMGLAHYRNVLRVAPDGAAENTSEKGQTSP